jgi:carboxypeptidase Taq
MDWMYQPVGSSASYGIHESMSRFIENMVGKSPEFWAYYLPVMKKITGETFMDVSHEQMLRAVNYVTPSKIRIEADEVTYGLHIVIRFEIERDLFSGKLSIDELPQAWNQKYMDYLGVEIEHDSEGVMQDTHWAGGSFGYFPSYALGNIYDGIWLTKLDKDLPDWRQQIQGGSFKETKQWLTDNVYGYGNLYDPEDLVKEVTGKGLVVKPFIDYLEQKFKTLYG